MGVRREKFLFFKNLICFFIVFHVDNADIAEGFRGEFRRSVTNQELGCFNYGEFRDKQGRQSEGR